MLHHDFGGADFHSDCAGAVFSPAVAGASVAVHSSGLVAQGVSADRWVGARCLVGIGGDMLAVPLQDQDLHPYQRNDFGRDAEDLRRFVDDQCLPQLFSRNLWILDILG